MEVFIDKKKYKVNENEYTRIEDSRFNALRLHNDLAIHMMPFTLISTITIF